MFVLDREDSSSLLMQSGILDHQLVPGIQASLGSHGVHSSERTCSSGPGTHPVHSREKIFSSPCGQVSAALGVLERRRRLPELRSLHCTLNSMRAGKMSTLVLVWSSWILDKVPHRMVCKVWPSRELVKKGFLILPLKNLQRDLLEGRVSLLPGQMPEEAQLCKVIQIRVKRRITSKGMF